MLRGWWVRIAVLVLIPFASVSGAAPPDVAEAGRAFARGDYPRSRAILENLLRRNPNDSLVRFNLGNVLFVAGDFAGASVEYQRVITARSPLANASRLYLAKCHRRLGQSRGSFDLLSRLRKVALPSGLKEETEREHQSLKTELIQTAIRSYREARYETGLAALTALLDHEPGTDLETLMGLTLIRLGRRDEAAVVLQRVRSRGDRSARMNASEILADLERATKTSKPLGAFLEWSLGYDSNALELGTDLPRFSGWVNLALVSFEFETFSFDLVSNALNFALQWRELYGKSSERVLSPSFQSAFNFRLSDESGLSLIPGVRYIRYGSDPFLLKPGARLVLKNQSENSTTEIQLGFERSIPRFDIYDYLEGDRRWISATHGRKWGAFRPSLNAGYFVDENRDFEFGTLLVPLSNRARALGLGLEYEVFSGWNLAYRPSLTWREYDTPAQPGGVLRRDRSFEQEFAVERSLSASSLVWISFYRMDNRSTLGPAGASSPSDKNFAQSRAMLGWTWSN